uniref:F-box domain-containing protein n=1 Tax=Brassica campestris TaxID=3711 RepID=M4C9S8_BRACM
MDFVNKLGTDTLLSILSCLDDPSDLVRASAVSRSWRDFVIRYGLSKKLCFKLFHQLTCVDRVNEESSGSWSRSSLMDTKLLEREHRAFALLAKGCTSSPIRSCVADTIIASSTDNYLKKIVNTVDEIVHIHPFQAYFQPGSPIYSSDYVRFRLGHLDNNNSEEKDNYVWTYTSQEFPMAQENRLQNFKLPEPVVCIGGYMLIEFLGRVQTRQLDGLYYICVLHVRVMGRSLANSFRLVDPDDDESGKFGLMVVRYCDPKEMGEMEVEEEVVHRQFRQAANYQQRLNFLHRDEGYAWLDVEDDGYAESDGEEV